MKRSALFVSILLLALATSWLTAQSAPATPVSSIRPDRAAALVKGPYLQALTGTSVQIRWQAKENVRGEVVWGTAPDRLDQSMKADTYPKQVVVLDENDSPLKKTVWMQRVELAKLAPGTAYHYRVRQGGDAGETFRFTTPARGLTRFRFAVYGDTRTYPADHHKVARAMIKAKPAFVVHTGDLISSGGRWWEWQSEFFDPLYPLLTETPMWVVRGNHDGGGYFTGLFHVPRPIPKYAFYRFDYGNARFLVLEWKAPRIEMFAWLEMQLAARPRPTWTFIFVHYPVFNATSKRGYGRGWERERLALLCQRYGVDMVFSGHDHDYMRTVPVLAYRTTPGQPTTYVVTAGGGAPLYRPNRCTFHEKAVRVHHFCRLDIDGRTLAFRAINANDGSVIDSLDLEKDAKGAFVRPADYRARARDVASINAIETLRRELTAFGLPATDPGREYPLRRDVYNPFDGPVKVTVRFSGSRSRWHPADPVSLTLPPHGRTPFRMVLKCKVSMENEPETAHLVADYELPDGRKGTLHGEGFRIGSRPRVNK